MCFGNETGLWERQQSNQKNKSPHMRCLRLLSGATLQNKVPNEKTKGSTAKCEYAARCKEILVTLARVCK